MENLGTPLNPNAVPEQQPNPTPVSEQPKESAPATENTSPTTAAPSLPCDKKYKFWHLILAFLIGAILTAVGFLASGGLLTGSLNLGQFGEEAIEGGVITQEEFDSYTVDPFGNFTGELEGLSDNENSEDSEESSNE